MLAMWLSGGFFIKIFEKLFTYLYRYAILYTSKESTRRKEKLPGLEVSHGVWRADHKLFQVRG